MKKQDIIKEVESYINGKYNLGIIDDKIVKDCINKTLETINYTRCCEKLPSFKEISDLDLKGVEVIQEFKQVKKPNQAMFYNEWFKISCDLIMNKVNK